MAAKAPLSSVNHTLAKSTGHSVSLDPAVVTLLQQQAEISAKLAVLLPRAYSFDARAELLNLRHKLRVLQTFASDRRLPEVTPILSEVEEARHLEYEIECIEAVCLDHGHDLHDPHVVDALDTIHAQDAPPGFGDWLRQNLSTDDPIPRAWRQRNALMAESGVQSGETGHGEVSHQRPQMPYHFLKCPHEGCIHYIYGFLHQTELDLHCRSHAAQMKRDSALSVSGNTPPSPLFEHSLQRRPTNLTGWSPASPTRPLARPSSFSSGLQLPPLVQPSRKRDHHALLHSYSFGSEHQARASVDVNPDVLLPLLKRSRVGPRLESISELGLLQGTDMCLYCKYSREKCDTNTPCYSCTRNATAMEHVSFWPAIGCHRGPLAGLANNLIPEFLCPGRLPSPLASPRAQRRDINDFLERTYWIRPEHVRVVQTNLDFEDGWWTQDLAAFPPTVSSQSPHETEPKDQPPPVLKVLASSENMDGNAYNFWQLLKLSGLLSASRGAEAVSFPVLYHAKLFLRELLFFDLQQPQPAVVAVPANPSHGTESGAYENMARHSIVRSCAAQFLQSFEDIVQRGHSVEPRTWLATFFSLCIFSIIRTLLVDMASLKQMADKRPSSALMHALYNATATIFCGWLPHFFDDLKVAAGDENKDLYSTASMIIKRGAWSERGISSTEDFLLGLGAKEMEGVWHGFMREQSFTRKAISTGVTLRSGEQRPLPAMIAPPDPATHTPDSAGMAWAHAESAPGEGAHLVPASNGTFASHLSVCEHATGGGLEFPAHVRRDDKPPTPPQRTPRTQPLHLANVDRGYLCVEVSYPDTMDRMPELPLSECGSCISNKRYASLDDAVTHLRQAHFSTCSSDGPPSHGLEKWTQEVQLPSCMQKDREESPGRVVCVAKSAQDSTPTPLRLLQPVSPPLLRQRFSPQKSAFDGLSRMVHPQPTTLLPSKNQPRQQPLPAYPVSPPEAGTASSLGTKPMLASPTTKVSPVRTPPVQAQKSMPQSPTSTRETPELIATTLNMDHRAHVSIHRKGSAPAPPLSTVGTSNGIAKPEDIRQGHRNRCPYPACGRVFKDLPAHMLTHMEERPEKCPIETCEYHTKGFARKYDKNRHALTHYKGTMVCPFCHRIGSDYEKAFNRADVFKRHLTAVHNVEQTPPNSRKSTVALGLNRQGPVAGETGEQDAAARCSICRSQFVSAQDFYEHLDDCVLNVIVPSAPKNAGAASNLGGRASGEGPIDKGALAVLKPAQTLKAVATKMMTRSEKSPSTASTTNTMGASRADQMQSMQVNQPALSKLTIARFTS